MSDINTRVSVALNLTALLRERFFTSAAVPEPLSRQEAVAYAAAMDLLTFYFKCGTPDDPVGPPPLPPPDPPPHAGPMIHDPDAPAPVPAGGGS